MRAGIFFDVSPADRRQLGAILADRDSSQRHILRDRTAYRTTFRDSLRSRVIAFIGLPEAYSHRIRMTVSTTNIPIPIVWKKTQTIAPRPSE